MRRLRSFATKSASEAQKGSDRVEERDLRQVGSRTAPKETLDFVFAAAFARSFARAAARLASMRAFASGVRISSLSSWAAAGDRAVERLLEFVGDGFLKKEVMLFCMVVLMDWVV